jgi:hypothetical protein
MPSVEDEEEDAAWFSPAWETEDEPTPPGLRSGQGRGGVWAARLHPPSFRPTNSCTWRLGDGHILKLRARRGRRSSLPRTGCAANSASRNPSGAKLALPWAARKRRLQSRSSRPNRRNISARRRGDISTAWWPRPRPASSTSGGRSGACARLRPRNPGPLAGAAVHPEVRRGADAVRDKRTAVL